MKRKTTPKEMPSILSIKDDLSKPIDLMDRLIQKEISTCAGLIGVEADELQAWIDLQIAVPAKTILTLLRVAKQYELDPLQEEVLLTLYDDHWQVSISVDGWIQLINKHPAFAGMSFTESPETDQGFPLWMECTIHRSDRAIPTIVREYLAEVRYDSDIWKKMPRRMLRHRVLQQCARLAIGISGMDLRIREGLPNLQNTSDFTLGMGKTKLNPNKELTQVDKLKGILQTYST